MEYFQIKTRCHYDPVTDQFYDCKVYVNKDRTKFLEARTAPDKGNSWFLALFCSYMEAMNYIKCNRIEKADVVPYKASKWQYPWSDDEQAYYQAGLSISQ